MRQRREREVMQRMRRLGFLRAQKLPACRQVEEQLSHLHARARRATGGFDLGYLPAVDDDLRALGRFRVALASGECEPAHAGDARQRLTAKPHGGYGREILSATNLAGGVAFQTQQCVVATHAEAVVRDADQAASARLDFHRDSRGLRIERILDQFLDDTGRALDDLARRDLVRDVVRQEFDPVHAGQRVGCNVWRQELKRGNTHENRLVLVHCSHTHIIKS